MPSVEKGTAGLEYVLLPDGTYGVKAGTAIDVEEVVIPSKHSGKAVTQILDEAFEYAKKLKSIKIPDSVTSIGKEAFRGCLSLESVTFKNTTGWWLASSYDYDISSEDLANTSIAARYLRSTYVQYHWKRS